MLTIAMFNTRLHNWLINDELAPPPPQVLDELLAPPLLDLWGPPFL